jgi:hypothetical protein
MRHHLAAWPLAAAILGCASRESSSPAEAYVRALSAGHLDAAYALTSPAFRAQVSTAQFEARFADPAARAARVAAIQSGLAALSRAVPELFDDPAAETPVEVVLRFAAAVRAGRFDEACRCLGAALRERYTPELLARDFHLEPTAGARLERAVLAVEGIPEQVGTTVRFPLPDGGAVVVAREADGWKLDALE